MTQTSQERAVMEESLVELKPNKMTPHNIILSSRHTLTVDMAEVCIAVPINYVLLQRAMNEIGFKSDEAQKKLQKRHYTIMERRP